MKHLLFLLSFSLLSKVLFSQTAVNDYSTSYQNNTITINPLNNDNGCTGLSITQQPANGNVSTIELDGSFKYTPNTDFIGKDSLQYTTTYNGNSSFAWVYFTIKIPDNIIETNCITPKLKLPSWEMTKSHASIIRKGNISNIFIGDIDNDNRNEIIGVLSNVSSENYLIIFNDNLEAIDSIFLGGSHSIKSLAIADINNDNIAEIFILFHDNSSFNYSLACYHYTGSTIIKKWDTNTAISFTYNAPELTLSITDVNADGIPDILAYNKIFNAQTGNLEVTLPSIGSTDIYLESPIFADIDNDGIQDVIAGEGYIIIKVSINNANGVNGNSAYIWKQLTGFEEGKVAIADIDLDGYLEIIVHSKYSSLYVWKPYSSHSSTPQLLTTATLDPIPPCIPLIADIDNDGYPEIVIHTSQFVHAYKYDPNVSSLTKSWEIQTKNTSSFFVSDITAFDFNFDNYPEIVFIDNGVLKIIDGVDGSELSSYLLTNSSSFTNDYYPIIVDLKKDGITQILAILTDHANGSFSISALKSVEDSSWVPARSVWNQFVYNVVNINEDLSIPQYQLHPTTAIEDPKNRGTFKRLFNNFLQQSVSINKDGEIVFPDADLQLIQANIEPLKCDSLMVKLIIKKIGTKVLNEPIPITVYKDKYQQEIIKTDYIDSIIRRNEYKEHIITFYPNEIENVTDLVFVVNDMSKGIAQNGNLQAECDTSNNLFTISSSPIYLSQYIELKDSICQGKLYNRNGFNISGASTSVPGEIIDAISLKSINGCDSIVNLKLMVYPTMSSNFSVETCYPYKWNNILYSDDGLYTQHLTTAHGCDSLITMNLRIVKPIVEIENLTEDFCDGYKGLLVAKSNTKNIQWNTGEITDTIVIDFPGTYWVKATVDDCIAYAEATLKHCDFKFFIPNAIIPNDPLGINNEFKLTFKSAPPITNFEIVIFNRWGNMVFRSNDIHFKWDGKYKGQLYANTSYQYVIRYRSTIGKDYSRTGIISVIE